MTGIREKPERRNSDIAWRRRRVGVDADHVGARHHHLADEGVAELEDRVDHLALVVLDHVGLAGQVDQLAQLALAGERARRGRPARGHGVAERDEQPAERAEHAAQPDRNGAARERDRSACWRPSVPRGDADDHEHDSAMIAMATRPGQPGVARPGSTTAR